MTLADKITQLRKQKGWSQIDLADQLDVSRQSVSKWEMAQAVPELDKIIKMSELFDVTTDYLLKENAPEPEPEPEPTPEPGPTPAPEPEPAPVPKPPRKKWPWILAAVLALPVIITVLLIVLSYVPYSNVRTFETEEPFLDVQPTPTPSPSDETRITVSSSPTPGPVEQTDDNWSIAISSTDEEYNAPTMEVYTYTNGQTTLEGEPVTPEEMEAIAREYEPFGVSYDPTADRWFYEGTPVRVFTDILISNGMPLEGGAFQGVMRNFAGQGEIDIRTVRDYENPNAEGYGTLTDIEKFEIAHPTPPPAILEESPTHHPEPSPTHHPEH